MRSDAILLCKPWASSLWPDDTAWQVSKLLLRLRNQYSQRKFAKGHQAIAWTTFQRAELLEPSCSPRCQQNELSPADHRQPEQSLDCRSQASLLALEIPACQEIRG